MYILLGVLGSSLSSLIGVGSTHYFLLQNDVLGGDFLSGVITFDSLVLAVIALTYPHELMEIKIKRTYLMPFTFTPFIVSAISSLYSILQLDASSGSQTLAASSWTAPYIAILSLFLGLGAWASISLFALLSITIVRTNDSQKPNANR